MQKKYVKILITLLTITMLALFLSSCVIFLPSIPPIVEIKIVNDKWAYKIYVDGKYAGVTSESGKLTLHTINEGYHHFKAEDTSPLKRYGEKWQTIRSGYNRVEIYTE